jgi:hypothetical protein
MSDGCGFRPGKLDRLVDFMWPFTITIGVLMAVAVIVFVAGMFIIVYGALYFRWFPQWVDYLSTVF